MVAINGSSHRNLSSLFVAITLLMVGGLLIWDSMTRYGDYVTHQQQLMENSVRGEVEEISTLLKRLHNQVGLFAEEQYDIINYLAAYPGDDDMRTYMEGKLRRQFPEFFAVTIADKAGHVLFENIDSLANEICEADLKKFIANNYNYNIYIHPHHDASHFDVMVPWGNKKTVKGIIFVSFRPNMLARLLGNSQIPGHNLLLLRNDIPDMVEVAAKGTRFDNPDLQANLTLSSEQFSNIAYSKPVPGTRWNLTVIPDDKLFAAKRNTIIIQTGAIYLAFIIISVIMLWLVKQAEKRRDASEQKLKTAKEQLQQALDFSDVGMWEWDILTRNMQWSSNIQNIFPGNPPATYDEYIDTIHSMDRKPVEDAMRNAYESGLPHHIEHRICMPDGTIRWIEIGGNVERDDRMCSVRMIGLARDITNRKKAEENRLDREKKQRDTLIMEVHHRIKNNLQGVIGLLRQHSMNSPESDKILDIAVSQLHSVSIVHGLQSEEKYEEIDLCKLVTMICRAAGNLMPARKILLTPPEPGINAYVAKEEAVPVALVLNELVFNAIKHGSSGQARVPAIRVRIDMQDNDHIMVEVRNSSRRLPSGFDFDNEVGLGTGLTLIKSLLPHAGAQLSIQNHEDGVIAQLILSPPVVFSLSVDEGARQYG